MADISSAQSGPWNVGATWVGGTPPGTGDVARILNTHVVSLPADTLTGVCEVQAGGELATATFTLSCNSTFNIGGAQTSFHNSGTVSGTGKIKLIQDVTADCIQKWGSVPSVEIAIGATRAAWVAYVTPLTCRGALILTSGLFRDAGQSNTVTVNGPVSGPGNWDSYSAPINLLGGGELQGKFTMVAGLKTMLGVDFYQRMDVPAAATWKARYCTYRAGLFGAGPIASMGHNKVGGLCWYSKEAGLLQFSDLNDSSYYPSPGSHLHMEAGELLVNRGPLNETPAPAGLSAPAYALRDITQGKRGKVSFLDGLQVRTTPEFARKRRRKTYQEAVQALPGIAAHFSLDDAAAAYDVIGANNMATVGAPAVVKGMGGLARQCALGAYLGNPGTAFGLNGVNSYIIGWVNVPDATKHGIWAKLGETGGFGIGIGANPQPQWSNPGDQLVILFEGVRWIPTGVTVTPGIHMFTLVLNGSSKPVAYLDAVQVFTDTGANPGAPSANAFIGGDGSVGEDRDYADWLDEVSYGTGVITTALLQELLEIGRDEFAGWHRSEVYFRVLDANSFEDTAVGGNPPRGSTTEGAGGGTIDGTQRHPRRGVRALDINEPAAATGDTRWISPTFAVAAKRWASRISVFTHASMAVASAIELVQFWWLAGGTVCGRVAMDVSGGLYRFRRAPAADFTTPMAYVGGARYNVEVIGDGSTAKYLVRVNGTLLQADTGYPVGPASVDTFRVELLAANDGRVLLDDTVHVNLDEDTPAKAASGCWADLRPGRFYGLPRNPPRSAKLENILGVA